MPDPQQQDTVDVTENQDVEVTQTQEQEQPQSQEPKTQEATDPGTAQGNPAPSEEITKLRREAASYRVKAKESQQRVESLEEKLNQISVMLGLTSEEEADPAAQLEGLQQKLAARDREITRLQHERIIEHAATAAGANLELLMPWLNGSQKLAALDGLEGEELAAQAGQVVADALAKYPAFAKTKQVAKHTAQVEPEKPAGEKPTYTEADIKRLEAKGDWAEINRLVREGLI